MANSNKATALAKIFFSQYGKTLILAPIVATLLVFVWYMFINISWFLCPTYSPSIPYFMLLYAIHFVTCIATISWVINEFINKNKYIAFTIIPVESIYKYLLVTIVFMSSYVLAWIFASLTHLLIYSVFYLSEMVFFNQTLYMANNNLAYSLYEMYISLYSNSFLFFFIPSLYFTLSIVFKNIRNAIIYTSVVIVIGCIYFFNVK